MHQPAYLSLTFHLHQPVGNFNSVFEKAYQGAYQPLLECLERHPLIRAGFHISGSLWEWLRANHPEFLQQVRHLVECAQIEVLTGGYHEPVLPILSDADKLAQISRLNHVIANELGTTPQGMWLTERVWEPHLPKPLADAGVRYTIVDDAHFYCAGFAEHELFGYYTTEEQGHRLYLFPSFTPLRDLIPYSPVEQVMQWLWQMAEKPLAPDAPPRLICVADDAGKFGLWPHTHSLCWEENYVDRLFEAIASAHEWLEAITPSRYLEGFPVLGLAYLPAASYREMMAWALPAHQLRELQAYRGERLPPDLEKFLRGGYWRHFLVKYPEANQMQKRVARTSQLVWQMAPGKKRQEALEHVWAAQSGAGYWHGVLGGIYHGHIRAANYAHLLAADEILLKSGLEAGLETHSAPSCGTEDLDQDGHAELIATCVPFRLHLDLARGGTLKEWDYFPGKCNLVNVMTRREEAYHEKLQRAALEGRVITPDMPEWDQVETTAAETVRARELGLERLLFHDWYRRGVFIDHFLGDDATLLNFFHNRYPEEGDFVNLGYNGTWKSAGNFLRVTLSREGHTWVSGEFLPVRVTKEFYLRSGEPTLEVHYQIQNLSASPVVTRFGIETCSGFCGQLQVGNDWYSALRVLEHGGISHYLFAGGKKPAETTAEKTIPDRELALPFLAVAVPERLDHDVRMSRPATLWHFPLEPVVQSEVGYERAYQGVVFLHFWPVQLPAYGFWDVSIDIKISTP